MPPSPTILVIGSYVQDLSWKCRSFPAAGETTVGTFTTGPGGKGSNQAIAAARAGTPQNVLYIGAVGRDAFAREARAIHRAEKIPAHLVEKPRHPTGTAAILVNEHGQNEIIVALGANAHLTRSDIPPAALKRAKILVVQHESNMDTTAWALKTARRAGATTILNPAPMRPDLDPATLAHVDILIPNETEFTALVNLLHLSPAAPFTEKTLHTLFAQTPSALHALCRRLLPPNVIITLGSQGCFISQPTGHTHIPAHTAIKVVDTTGAGDAFVGGLAAGLARQNPAAPPDLIAAARYGTAVAALSVTKPGTAPSMPTKREITAFLAKRASSR